MANPNADPLKARLALAKRRKPGNLDQLKQKLWSVIIAAEEIAEKAALNDNDELRLRAGHAIIQASGAYAKLFETGELEARVAALEAERNGKAA